MFYVKKNKDDKKFVKPKQIYIKVDTEWKRVRNVFVNKLKRKMVDLEMKETNLHKAKEGVRSKIKKLENIDRTTEQDNELKKLRKIEFIMRLEMTELYKQNTDLQNTVYFNNKIVPGEKLIRLMKDGTNNGAGNYKVLKLTPFGKLLERPLGVFNNKRTDGTINNTFYRIIDTNKISIEDSTKELRRRLGQNFSIIYKTPGEMVLELDKIMKIHERTFEEQLSNIKFRHETIKEWLDTARNYKKDIPEDVIENFNSDYNAELGFILKESQRVKKFEDCTKDNIHFEDFKNKTLAKLDIAKHINKVNDDYPLGGLEISHISSSKKIGLEPGMTRLDREFNKHINVTEGYVKSVDQAEVMSCNKDDDFVITSDDMVLEE